MNGTDTWCILCAAFLKDWTANMKPAFTILLAAGLFTVGHAARGDEESLESEGSVTIDRATLDGWATPFRGWHYHPDHVVPPSPGDGLGFQMVDCPLVWQHGDQWRMFYTGFDGQGYQTALAVSDDLVHWTPKGLAMGFGAPDTFDHGGVAFCGLLFGSYDLKGDRRQRTVARPRQLAMYLARTLLAHSYPEIGRACGRDHTTVIAACQRIQELLPDLPELQLDLEQLQRRIAKGTGA